MFSALLCSCFHTFLYSYTDRQLNVTDSTKIVVVVTTTFVKILRVTQGYQLQVALNRHSTM